MLIQKKEKITKIMGGKRKQKEKNNDKNRKKKKKGGEVIKKWALSWYRFFKKFHFKLFL
jgi:hypothetical protein